MESNTLTNYVLTSLEEMDWKPSLLKTQQNPMTIAFTYVKQLPDKTEVEVDIHLTLHIDEEKSDILILCYHPLKLQPFNEEPLQDIICVANTKLRTGCFEYDAADELVWYKATYRVYQRFESILFHSYIKHSLNYMMKWMDTLYDVATRGTEVMNAHLMYVLSTSNFEGMGSQKIQEVFTRKHFE